MTRKDIASLFKRFFITFFCCVPIFLVIGYFLEKKMQDWILTFIFIVIGGSVFALEELIHFKRRQKRELLKQELKDKDYFKQTDAEKTEKRPKKQNKNNQKTTNKNSK
ncbi:MAG: hypothetical protein ACI4TZ_01645 [Christensenellales bacterium]